MFRFKMSVLLLMIGVVPAAAHGRLKSVGATPIEVQRQNCAADFAKFCPGQQMGGGRMGRCLINYMPNLTNACHDTVAHWCPTGKCP